MNHLGFLPWIWFILVLALLVINFYTQRLLEKSNRLARTVIRSLIHSTEINATLMDTLADIVSIGDPESIRRVNEALIAVQDLRRREAEQTVDNT